MSSTVTDSAKAAAEKFIKFIDASPSPYHAVDECKTRLIEAGFEELKEINDWNIKPMGKYFLTRNQSSIIAFTVGGKWVPGNGFTMFGAHTDSPCLRVKVISKKEKHGYVQVGTECYGGGNWVSWFDRDLRLAGRLLVKENGKIVSKLVHINKPIMRVPNLAIHLERRMNDNFSVNKETDLVPILSQYTSSEINSKPNDPLSTCAWKHHSVLINLLIKEANISADDLVDFDLFLADHQPSAIGGANDDFVFAPRLDNLMSTYTGIMGLISSCKTLQDECNIRMLLAFDNEEVGSLSAQGAESKLIEVVLRRLSKSANNSVAFEQCLPKSTVLSADMAHAVHPNYSSKHETNMMPSLYGGPVIKTNNNNRYATTAATATIVREVAKLAEVPLQDVMVRNDSPCGTTIGPIISGRLGIKTADIGAPQLSMHSIREVCGTVAIEQCEKLYEAFFNHCSTVDANIIID